jgi:hypothetical protein
VKQKIEKEKEKVKERKNYFSAKHFNINLPVQKEKNNDLLKFFFVEHRLKSLFQIFFQI